MTEPSVGPKGITTILSVLMELLPLFEAKVDIGCG
jgi:hypothetical protein